MKSQKKMDTATFQEFENHMVQFLIVWLKYANEFKGNPIFWKLHNLFCNIKDFASLYRMIGRISAEGYENKHLFMRMLKEMMRSLINTKRDYSMRTMLRLLTLPLQPKSNSKHHKSTQLHIQASAYFDQESTVYLYYYE